MAQMIHPRGSFQSDAAHWEHEIASGHFQLGEHLELEDPKRDVAVTVFKQWHAKHLDLPHSMNPVVVHKLITTEEADELAASS